MPNFKRTWCPAANGCKTDCISFLAHFRRKPTGPLDNYKISIQTGSDPAGTAAAQTLPLALSSGGGTCVFYQVGALTEMISFPLRGGNGFALRSPLFLADIKTFPSAQALSRGRTCGKRSVCELSG